MPLPDKYYFSGTPEQLSILLPFAQIVHQAVEELEIDGGGGTTKTLPVDVKGKILVIIKFTGLITGTQNTHRVENSFRLMNDNPQTIPKSRLDYLGNRIKSLFNAFSFTTGKGAYTYNESDQGFNRSWGYFATQQDAQKVFEQLLDVNNLSPNWQRFTHSSVPIPGDRFQNPPDKVSQANVLVRLYPERPTALMKFNKAQIKFPHIRKSFLWVDKNFKVHDVYQAILDHQESRN